MPRRGEDLESGARTADRNDIAANWFTIARSVWNMHDALLIEQRRTNQLLEVLIQQGGGTIPDPLPAPDPIHVRHGEIDPGTGLPIDQVVQ
jgi:hypothetical protein